MQISIADTPYHVAPGSTLADCLRYAIRENAEALRNVTTQVCAMPDDAKLILDNVDMCLSQMNTVRNQPTMTPAYRAMFMHQMTMAHDDIRWVAGLSFASKQSTQVHHAMFTTCEHCHRLAVAFVPVERRKWVKTGHRALVAYHTSETDCIVIERLLGIK